MQRKYSVEETRTSKTSFPGEDTSRVRGTFQNKEILQNNYRVLQAFRKSNFILRKIIK